MEIPGYYFWEWPESPWAKQRTTGAPRHPGNDQFFTTGSFAIPRDFLFYPRNRFTPKRPISHRITPNEKHHPRPPPRTMTRNNTNDTRPTMRMTTRTTARMTAGLPVPTEPKIANANDDANDKTNESTKGNTSDGADDDRTTARPGRYDDDGSVGHVSGGSDSERGKSVPIRSSTDCSPLAAPAAAASCRVPLPSNEGRGPAVYLNVILAIVPATPQLAACTASTPPPFSTNLGNSDRELHEKGDLYS
ncbi:hypothetical protein BJ912DRAFT_1065825 [Pholiota molesta]|nr:hypothetical protein BJ912DRAFT_1065825 [Pholiota molesta]